MTPGVRRLPVDGVRVSGSGTFLLPLGILMALLAGCGDRRAETRSSRLVVAVEQDIGSLDPIRIVDNFTLRIGAQVFEGLVTLDERGGLRPLLAESWESAEGHALWRFRIRSGVRFHPDPCFGPAGTRELTAEDVAFSLRRMISKESASAFALAPIVEGASAYQRGEAQSVAGIRVSGPQTVEIRLVHPDPHFLHRLTSPWFAVVPPEAVALGPDVFGRSSLPGTGPFRMVSHSDTEVTMERFDGYWRETGGDIPGLVFRTIKNERFRAVEMENGRVDLCRLEGDMASEAAAGGPGPEGQLPLKPALARRFGAKIFPALNTHFVGFNTARLPEPLRKAVAATVDREQIARLATGPLGKPNESPLPDAIAPWRHHAGGCAADLDRARALVRLLGPKEKATFELLVHGNDNSERVGELVQAQCAAVGIEVRLAKLDFNAAVERVLKGEADAFVLSFEYVFSSPGLNLATFFAKEAIPMPNLFRYDSAAAAALIGEMRGAGGAPAGDWAARLERLIIAEAPAAFLFERRTAVAYREDLEAVRVTYNNIIPFEEIRTAGGVRGRR